MRLFFFCLARLLDGLVSVSYTHLDVYKRQILYHILALSGRGKNMGNTGNPDNKELVIHSIITAMSPSLDSEKLRHLDDILREKLHGMKLEEECTDLSTWNDDNEYIIRIFLANKKLIGCKAGSLEQYALSLKQFFGMIDKNYRDVKKDDIKYFLAIRSGEVAHNTLANIKTNLSSFFTFLHDEGYIPTNPIKPIKIKRVDVENIHLTIDEEVAVRDVRKSLRLSLIHIYEKLTDEQWEKFVEDGYALQAKYRKVSRNAELLMRDMFRAVQEYYGRKKEG